MQDKLKDQLVRHEGFRSKLYKCSAGKWTIGIGRNVEDKGISEREAMLLLDNDIAQCKYQLITGFPWYSKLDEVRQAVLLNMCFNLGFRGLCGFKKMLKYCEDGEYRNCAVEMSDSKWARQVKGRADELADQMVTGEWE